MEVYSTLTEAVQQLSPDDKRRVYEVGGPDYEHEYYVLAPSPAAAALAVVGEEFVKLVSQRDRYKAALGALNEQAKAAGEKELA
jgi:hypothetical protein